MTRDPSGIIWFNVNPGRGGIGRLDPKTEKIDVFIPPAGMSPTGGATTVDYDGKGKIWSSSPDGALRFDPETDKFTEFKSITYKTPNGTGVTYGMAADRDGNGWWAEMTLDIIGKGNVATGKSEEVRLAPVQAELDRVTPEARKFYETYNQPDFNNPLPWAQGPRRMGTDKADDVLWVGNSWGASLARIDTKTNETTYVPLPGEQQPYHVHVDKSHGAWTNLWGADRVMRYDPKSATWTAFDLPTRGAEPRYVSVDRARRRADAGGAAVFPGAQGRGHDLAQRGRAGGAQEPGRATVSVLLARQATGRKGLGQQAASARDGISWAGRSIRAVIWLAATSLGGSDGTAPLMARLDPSEHSTA